MGSAQAPPVGQRGTGDGASEDPIPRLGGPRSGVRAPVRGVPTARAAVVLARASRRHHGRPGWGRQTRRSRSPGSRLEGRCPGPRVGSDGRDAALGSRPRTFWTNGDTRLKAPPTQGGTTARRRTARPGGPAGWEDGGGSPGRCRRRRSRANPGCPGCAVQRRGRAMSAPPSSPRAAEPARAPRAAPRPSPWRGSRTTSCWWRSGRTRAVSAEAKR